MSEAWRRLLDLDGKNPVVIAAGKFQTLFAADGPNRVRFEQIVRTDGTIYAARVLPIVVPTDTVVPSDSAMCIEIIRAAGPHRCTVLFTHEVRPVPYNVGSAEGDELVEIPGGVTQKEQEGTIQVGALQEFFQETGASADNVLAQMPLVAFPAPVSGGAQIELQSLYCVVYRGGTTEFRPGEGLIKKISVISLPQAFNWVYGEHEARSHTSEMKTWLALLLLDKAYREAYNGVSLFT